ncbi:major capsid protein [Streptomyces sp. NPDC051907]|uniref:major capsid protein n=1 Tax=Streptomyces sp. NPDC051907 TaxID=3155284 RepID=UPI00343D25DA
MSFLTDLLGRLAEVPAEDQPAVIQQVISETPNVNASELSAAVLEMFDSLTEGDAPATDETLSTLETLARVADGIGVINAAAEERSARAAEIGDRLRSLAQPAEGGGADGEGGGGEEPAAEVIPAEEPAEEETPGADDAAADQPEGAGADAPKELVAANVKKNSRVPLGGRNSALPAEQNGGGSKPFANFSLVAAADVPEFSTGQQLNGVADLARAWEARMGPMITGNVNSGRDGERTRVGLARIKRNVPEEFMIRDDSEAEEKIANATDETRLPGGSLVAAAGWCAPSEQLYDLCPIRMTPEGLIDLPSVTARRGGIRYPADFDWSAIWGSTGFYLTETEAIAGVEKTCATVPCPTEFEECRMDVSGMCIRTPILMERGWPERVEQFMQGSLLIHTHKMNARKLAKMEALSTAISFSAAPTPNPAASVTDHHGPGAVESLLSILELQAQHQRYRERLSQNATLELVAPYWMRGILKSDLRKKLGIDNRWNVTDSMIDGYLRAVGVSPQYVYDWQDALASGVSTDFGGDVPTQWPESVKFLLYPAGTFFQLQADVINLDGVYDHASLIQNVYTALFTEEGWQVCTRCGTSYVVTVNLCPNGLSGSHQAVNC